MVRGKTETYKSTCSYCGVGCGIVVHKDKHGKLKVEGDKDHPVNRGMLCSKGMNLHYAMHDTSDRLLYPEMRWSKNHPLKRVSWDTALERASAVFKTLIKTHGPDSVAFYVSGQCLTEEYYLANKLVKGYLGTNNIDTNSRLCMSSAVAGYSKMLGEDSVPISYEDIEHADCFFIAGANPAWCHPILFRRIEQHKEKHPHVKIIVADPRKTQSCEQADLHLQLLPGTDIFLYNAIARVLIENGDIDIKYIQEHVNGFEEYQKSVFNLSIEEYSNACGVPENDIKLAAKYIGDANGFITMWAMGLNQSAIGVQKNYSLISLNLITGHIGRPGSGPFSLTGQPNAMGGREVGGMASLLAAHRVQANPVHRKEVADFWGVESVPDKPGLTATQMIEALENGTLKAVWIICTNPLVSLPDIHRAEKAFANARFVVVQDISSKSDTLDFADLVLPAAGHFEKEGTMTNSERRIGHLAKVKDAPGEALADTDILIKFAQKMGFDGFGYQNAAEIFDEHCRLTKGTNIDISGLSYDRLQKEGSMQWPVPSTDSNGTDRLFADGNYYTADRKAQLYAIAAPQNTSPKPTRELPLILTTGRVRDHWHTMTKTGKVKKLNKHIPGPYLEMHPKDAFERGLKDGDIVKVSNTYGKAQVNVRITENIKPGVVFMPMHWGVKFASALSRANNLTSDRIDPISKEPDFKYSTVQVAKFTKKREKIVVVGAGAASYRFISTYRELNQEDEIHVFSKEAHPFYNRVLLPEYVNESLEWEKLLKFKKGEFEDLKCTLHVSNAVTRIDRTTKTITDSKGKVHTYDKLILATGSRANTPKDAPIDLKGVFTMRDKGDADRLRAKLADDAHVVILGGGLLGLELAAALKEYGISISIIHLGGNLMGRQLDGVASGMLADFVEEKGIDIYLNNTIQKIVPDSSPMNDTLNVTLQSGQLLQCDAVVYAVGTRPNIEFATEAGLDSARGLVVNEFLQTSDQDIYAMGEIAEYNGKLNGITAAAEQQADVVARSLNGDVLAKYDGTVSMNILKFSDLDLCSIGMPAVPANEEGYEVVTMLDPSLMYYKKCIIKDDKLQGAILLGDKLEFAEYKSLIESQTELGEQRLKILRSGGEVTPLKGKLVCSCNNVGRGNIEDAVSSGCHTMQQVCEGTGAGLGCGSCKPEVQSIINACSSTDEKLAKIA